jgi:hypothetical protein
MRLLIPALALAVVAVAVALALRWRRRHPRWQRPLPGYYVTSAYSAPNGYPAERIARAMQMAETCLIRHAKRLNAGRVAAVCLRAYVQVLPSGSAPDMGGRDVRGPAVGHVLQVGARLDSLAHELAHLCEAVLDREVDESHSLWEQDGLWRAVTAYEEWTIKQHWEST